MLVIRLFRVGKKNQPSFKIVVTDKKKPPKAGRFVEQVGFYNPLTKEKVLKGDRIKYWLSVGAKPSDTIFNLLVSEKIIEGKKIPSHKKSKKEGEVPKEEPQTEIKETIKAEVEMKEAKETEEKVEEKPVEPAPAEAPVAEPAPEEPQPSEAKPAEGAPVEEAQKEETE